MHCMFNGSIVVWITQNENKTDISISQTYLPKEYENILKYYWLNLF